MAFDAAYKLDDNDFTRFHYTVQPGGVANLYMTSISKATTENGASTATRVLSANEVSYGANPIPDIDKDALTTALTMDYCVAGVLGAGLKQSLDIILLCTVEAARSKYIYSKVNDMLSGVGVNAEHLKAVAQMYGHTQEKAGVTAFRPLGLLDYRALYVTQKELGNVTLDTFKTMGL